MEEFVTKDLCFLTASEGLTGLGSRTFTARDWTEACLNQVAVHDESVKAWVHVNGSQALINAERIDVLRSQGQVRALSGVPIGIKDNFNTLDMPTCMGSPIWSDFTPGNDARVVHSLKIENAVPLGKTVTAEFAVHAPGPTRNPHNLEYSPGTSSSGSAAAVASCMVPIATGTQTAGSIIRPASYCGIYGFKPSFGLIPRTGVLKTTDSLDTIGWFARSVADIRLLLDVLRVKGPDYPIGEQALNDQRRQSKSFGQSWRVGLVRGPKWQSFEPYARDSLLDFAKKLGSLRGVQLEEVELPSRLEAVHELHGLIYDRSLAYYFKKEFQQHSLVSPIMYEIISRGNAISLQRYLEAVEAQNLIAREVDQCIEKGFDILLDLSTGGEALKGLDAVDRPDHCLIWTFCWTPTLSVPVFAGPAQLPFGAQIISRRYSDYKLLEFAQFLESQGMVRRGPYPVPKLLRDSGQRVMDEHHYI